MAGAEGIMTLSDIQKRIREIQQLENDPEAAHAAEDKLHIDVLRAISKHQCAAPELCAREALRTQDIGFARWCA